MEPRSFDRGNSTALVLALWGYLELQWSRDLSIAETPQAGRPLREARRASMEPRSFDRGNRACPRTPEYSPRFNGAAIFRSRKRANLGAESEVIEELQWSRDLSIAETSPRPASRSRPAAGFNGAAIFRSRKLAVDGGEQLRILRFNGAAIFRSRKRERFDPSP